MKCAWWTRGMRGEQPTSVGRERSRMRAFRISGNGFWLRLNLNKTTKKEEEQALPEGLCVFIPLLAFSFCLLLFFFSFFEEWNFFGICLREVFPFSSRTIPSRKSGNLGQGYEEEISILQKPFERIKSNSSSARQMDFGILKRMMKKGKVKRWDWIHNCLWNCICQ